MKRSLLRRRTPIRRGSSTLKRGSSLIRKAPLKRLGERGRARLKVWAKVTAQAIAESKGQCTLRIPRICIGRATHGHHRLARGQGGPDTIENCMAACRPCHRYAHDHPRWARRAGLITPSWRKPILVLSRQRDETVMIDLGYGKPVIEVIVVDIRGDKVRLGINAPKEISVHRKEVWDAIRRDGRRENRAAAQVTPAQVKPEDLPGIREITPPVKGEDASQWGDPGGISGFKDGF